MFIKLGLMAALLFVNNNIKRALLLHKVLYTKLMEWEDVKCEYGKWMTAKEESRGLN
jgi:hypothetical protein